jgi:Lon protease-like protein
VSERHFIFPLGTVLFPGGALPLKIFEQRYLEMTKVCIRDSRPFGVCLIREGAEVGAPAVPETIGCLATIEEWEMRDLGMFQLVARGGERFRLLDTEVAANGLMSGTIERIGEEAPPPVDPACREVMELIVKQVGDNFPGPVRLDDALWVSCRLAEGLPLDNAIKQSLLEADTATRMQRLRDILAAAGLVR